MNASDPIRYIESQKRRVAPSTACLGAIFVAAGKISQSDTERIMDLQRREGWRFGEAALRLSLITDHDLVEALHKQYDLPEVQLDTAGDSDELIAAYQPYHRRTEELRALRTQLMVRWLKPPAETQQVLAVVSPGSCEGRSYVAANLAVLFSQLGGRTLLIDGDLRNPRQHLIFNIPDRIGLSAVLSGRADPDVAVPVRGFRNLVLLPAGAIPPNPLELLSRPLLPALLKEYVDDFDVILVDTPPALPYSDAQTIGFHAGSAIVLIRQNHTRIDDTTKVVRTLGDGGTKVIGTVMNGF